MQAAIDRLSIVPNDQNKQVRLMAAQPAKVVVGKWLSLEPKVLLLSDPAKAWTWKPRRSYTGWFARWRRRAQP